MHVMPLLWHEIGVKFGVLSEFVLVIQGYFCLQFSLYVWPSNYFLACKFPILACYLALGMLLFHALTLHIAKSVQGIGKIVSA